MNGASPWRCLMGVEGGLAAARVACSRSRSSLRASAPRMSGCGRSSCHSVVRGTAYSSHAVRVRTVTTRRPLTVPSSPKRAPGPIVRTRELRRVVGARGRIAGDQAVASPSSSPLPSRSLSASVRTMTSSRPRDTKYARSPTSPCRKTTSPCGTDSSVSASHSSRSSAGGAPRSARTRDTRSWQSDDMTSLRSAAGSRRQMSAGSTPRCVAQWQSRLLRTRMRSAAGSSTAAAKL
mmetsp:Transcript_2818/g.9948  ORF Transcript_2818/g.9948 Transcript_2818/m.9948 type:complete len:235 (+) Transcript_2818:296-1000(+)